MSALLALDELENSRVAHELIRLRLRVPIVHYLTNIHPKAAAHALAADPR
jgi:hypothetical protein